MQKALKTREYSFFDTCMKLFCYFFWRTLRFCSSFLDSSSFIAGFYFYFTLPCSHYFRGTFVCTLARMSFLLFVQKRRREKVLHQNRFEWKVLYVRSLGPFEFARVCFHLIQLKKVFEQGRIGKAKVLELAAFLNQNISCSRRIFSMDFLCKINTFFSFTLFLHRFSAESSPKIRISFSFSKSKNFLDFTWFFAK